MPDTAVPPPREPSPSGAEEADPRSCPRPRRGTGRDRPVRSIEEILDELLRP